MTRPSSCSTVVAAARHTESGDGRFLNDLKNFSMPDSLTSRTKRTGETRNDTVSPRDRHPQRRPNGAIHCQNKQALSLNWRAQQRDDVFRLRRRSPEVGRADAKGFTRGQTTALSSEKQKIC